MNHCSMPEVRAAMPMRLAWFELCGGGVQGAEKGDGSRIAEDHVEDLPGDDAEVEGDVDPGSVDGSPQAAVAGEGGIHHEDVADELVVGVEVGDVVEDDEGEEEAHGGEQEDFWRGVGWGGWWSLGIGLREEMEVSAEGAEGGVVVLWAGGHLGGGVEDF